MAFHIHAALAALCVAFVASQAHLPGQIYWNSMLPDVTMPRAISDALVSGKVDEIVPEVRVESPLLYTHGLGTENDEVLVSAPSENSLYTYGRDIDKDEIRVKTSSKNTLYKYGVGTEKNEVREKTPSKNSLYRYGVGTDKNEVREKTLSKNPLYRYGIGTDKDEVCEKAPSKNSLYRYGIGTDKDEVREKTSSENLLYRYGIGNGKDEVRENTPSKNSLYRYGIGADKDEVREKTPSKNSLYRYGIGADKDEVREKTPSKNSLYRYGIGADKDEVREKTPSKNSLYRYSTTDKDETHALSKNSLYRYGIAAEKDEGLVNPQSEKVLYTYHLGTDKNEILVNPPSMHLFLEKNLAPGTQMEMEFTRPEDFGYVFIPRQIADSIPFSSDKLSTILTQLSIEPESPKAQLMNDTLKHCEIPAAEGEVKTCATSLEALIDFAVQRLGKSIQAVSTVPEKYAKLQKFTILPGVKRIGDDGAVSCHQMDYAYAVFYCHDVIGVRAYVVPLVGTRGTKVKAVAVCHTNTSTWNPEHLSFKILKVKPGGEPVCHFLPQHNVLWTAQPHLAMPASDF